MRYAKPSISHILHRSASTPFWYLAESTKLPDPQCQSCQRTECYASPELLRLQSPIPCSMYFFQYRLAPPWPAVNSLSRRYLPTNIQWMMLFPVVLRRMAPSLPCGSRSTQTKRWIIASMMVILGRITSHSRSGGGVVKVVMMIPRS